MTAYLGTTTLPKEEIDGYSAKGKRRGREQQGNAERNQQWGRDNCNVADCAQRSWWRSCVLLRQGVIKEEQAPKGVCHASREEEGPSRMNNASGKDKGPNGLCGCHKGSPASSGRSHVRQKPDFDVRYRQQGL